MELNGIKVTEDMIPVGNKNRQGKKITAVDIVIHNTGNYNKGADAKAHASYLKNPATITSWHYTVDDKQIIQHLPINENGIHAGTTVENMKSIGIEICVNPDGDIKKATKHAEALTAWLMFELGIKFENILQHYDITKKNCPEQLRKNNPYSWGVFLKNVKECYNLYTINEIPKQVSVYRVRKKSALPETQVGAYTIFSNAVQEWYARNPYRIYDNDLQELKVDDIVKLLMEEIK